MLFPFDINVPLGIKGLWETKLTVSHGTNDYCTSGCYWSNQHVDVNIGYLKVCLVDILNRVFQRFYIWGWFLHQFSCKGYM